MKSIMLLFFSGTFLTTIAQNDSTADKLFYSFSVGAGIARSPHFENSNMGISGNT